MQRLAFPSLIKSQNRILQLDPLKPFSDFDPQPGSISGLVGMDVINEINTMQRVRSQPCDLDCKNQKTEETQKLFNMLN